MRRLGLGRVHAHRVRRCLDQRLEDVDAVVVVGALHDRGDTLQAHAGIDRRAGQIDHGAVGLTVVLHEHQIPDLHEAVAVLFRRTGRPTGDMLAVVVEDFRARPAGAGITHLPEVVLGADARERGLGHADFVEPDTRGFFVFLVDRDPEFFLGQAEFAGEKFPGEMNGLALEIIAEAEVAQHFEEGVMARGIADVFQVVVLAAGAHTALRRHGTTVVALVAAQKHVLERHHAGVRKQQGRIGGRYQAARGDESMLVPFEIFDETRTQRVGGHHGQAPLTNSAGSK